MRFHSFTIRFAEMMTGGGYHTTNGSLCYKKTIFFTQLHSLLLSTPDSLIVQLLLFAHILDIIVNKETFLSSDYYNIFNTIRFYFISILLRNL